MAKIDLYPGDLVTLKDGRQYIFIGCHPHDFTALVGEIVQEHTSGYGEFKREDVASATRDDVVSSEDESFVVDVLQDLVNGLNWYLGNYPDTHSQADDEMLFRASTAIALARNCMPEG